MRYITFLVIFLNLLLMYAFFDTYTETQQIPNKSVHL